MEQSIPSYFLQDVNHKEMNDSNGNRKYFARELTDHLLTYLLTYLYMIMGKRSSKLWALNLDHVVCAVIHRPISKSLDVTERS